VPNVLFCIPIVARASHTNFLGVGAAKDDCWIPDSFVATKKGMTLYSE